MPSRGRQPQKAFQPASWAGSTKKIKELLRVPKSKRLELILLVGYAPDGIIRIKKRKTTDEILSYNRY
jgi:hypothetical protein